MFKKAMFVLGSAVLTLALAGCDGNSPPTSAGSGAELPEGMEPFQPPDPGEVETRPAPGAGHTKSSSEGQN